MLCLTRPVAVSESSWFSDMQNDVLCYNNKVKSQESQWLQAFLVPTESYLNQIEGRKLFETNQLYYLYGVLLM